MKPQRDITEDIENTTVHPADKGKVESRTQGYGTKLNLDILYKQLPNKQILQKNGEYSNKVDIGLDNPISADAYLYLRKNTSKKINQDKTGLLDRGYVQAFRNSMASKLNNVKDKLAPVMNYYVGEYSEDDGETYLNGMPMDYRYVNMPDNDWTRRIKSLRGK